MKREKKIQKIIESNSQYNYFGVRAMTMNPITKTFEKAIIGKTIRNSYSWDDGETTGDELNGVSVISIDLDLDNVNQALEDVHKYDDRNQVVLIGSLYREYGEDPNEIIMSGNLTVLAIL